MQLPSEVSANQYSEAMLQQISKTKIRCVSVGDVGFPVEVYGTPKLCRFDINSSVSSITCAREDFLILSERDQYVIVHHEYAGLSGIEKPSLDESEYGISNQISSYLVDEVVKRLAIKPLSDLKTKCGTDVFFLSQQETAYCRRLEAAKRAKNFHIQLHSLSKSELISKLVKKVSTVTLACGFTSETIVLSSIGESIPMLSAMLGPFARESCGDPHSTSDELLGIFGPVKNIIKNWLTEDSSLNRPFRSNYNLTKCLARSMNRNEAGVSYSCGDKMRELMQVIDELKLR